MLVILITSTVDNNQSEVLIYANWTVFCDFKRLGRTKTVLIHASVTINKAASVLKTVAVSTR